MNSIRDLIVFNNDHQYTKNTNFANLNTNQVIHHQPAAVEQAPQSNNNLPPLIIEEILNDNQFVDQQDFIQPYTSDLSQTSFYASSLDTSMESTDNFLNDNSLYSFDQHPSNVTFDF